MKSEKRSVKKQIKARIGLPKQIKKMGIRDKLRAPTTPPRPIPVGLSRSEIRIGRNINNVSLVNNINLNKLRILFLGRKNSHYGSGIYMSAQMIVNSLKVVGVDVTYTDTHDEVSYLSVKYDVDLIWFYDDGAYSTKLIRKIRNLYGNGVPILVNSMYNQDNKRTKQIIKDNKSLNSNGYCNVYFGVFTKEAENQNVFNDNIFNFFSIPKTIRNVNLSALKYNERKDIFLGDYNKLMNSELTDNLNIYKLILKLKSEFNDINLYAVNHHPIPKISGNVVNNSAEIEYIKNNINVFSYRKDLISRIGEFRLYVCLINKETFSMVPAEAQSVGTIVLYRNMPQSLNSYFYYSAYMWESTDDLINVIRKIYYDENVWNELSSNSILNHKRNTVDNMKHILNLELEKLIIRHKKRL